MKQYGTADLRDRVTIYDVRETLDAEANHIETLVPVREVWAHVEVKSAKDLETLTGDRPTLRYEIVMRYDRELLQRTKKIGVRGAVCELVAPPYQVDLSQVVVEAVEHHA